MEIKPSTFFALLMATFLFGVILHLSIPVEIIVNSNQKMQQSYNGYKISVEQSVVRSIAYLNSLAIANQIQIYQNVRSQVIRLFDVNYRYQVQDISKSNMLSAYNLSFMNQQDLNKTDLNHTMWFFPGVEKQSQLNDLQKEILNQYAQIQEYIDCFNQNNQFLEGMESIEITITYLGEKVYFEAPASQNQQFQNLDLTLPNKQYNITFLNYQLSKKNQTLINGKNDFKSCSPILLDDVYPFAVVCLKLDVETVMRKITSALKVPDFQLSTSRYYLVKPLYQFQNKTYPQVISYFSSDDLTKVHVPQNQEFRQLNQSLTSLFNGKENYLLNVQQLDKTKTYYIIPIQTYNNHDRKQIIMYLIVVNDFAKSELLGANHYKQFFVIMIVPSIILLIISGVAMWLFIRPLFRKLKSFTSAMKDYCYYILKSDLNLEISEQADISDFVEIYKNLRCINLLNKLSNFSYLKVSPPERIIKLIRAIQLLDQLGTNSDENKINIYQNLGYCFHSTGDHYNALKYLELSIKLSLREIGGEDKISDWVQEQARNKKESKGMIIKKHKPTIKHLKYKLHRLCLMLYQNHIPGDKQVTKKLSRYAKIIDALSNSILSQQYVNCLILQSICEFQNGDQLEEMNGKIELIALLIKKLSANRIKKTIPIQILKSYFYYLKAKLLKSQSKYLESYETFVMALDGQRFDPILQTKIRSQLNDILSLCQIDHQSIDHVFHHLPIDKIEDEAQKEFIFLSDVSNPKMAINEFNLWKTKARKAADYIFENYIDKKDRISISQFCKDLKVICNLIEKGNNKSMLKKQLMNSIKARDKNIFSSFLLNLSKAIDRVKNLKKQKIFIIFLKEGPSIDSEQLYQVTNSSPNSIFIILSLKTNERVLSSIERVYLVDFQSFQDIDTILGNKVIKKADNIVYLF